MKKKLNSKVTSRLQRQAVTKKPNTFPIDQNEVWSFVSLLTGSVRSKNIFTAIKKSSMAKPQIKTIVGSIEEAYQSLVAWNRDGFDIFMAVNECDGDRKNENVKAIRAVFFDNDSENTVEPPLAPTFQVKSGRGGHGYFLVNDMQVDEFTKIQSAIAKSLETDPTVKDPARLMRVPGFAHVKDPSNPKPVSIFARTDLVYTTEQIKQAFHVVDQYDGSAKSKSSQGVASITDRKFKSWAKDLPTDEGSANPMGGRNNTALNLVREGLAFGMKRSVIAGALEDYCLRSGLSESEVDGMIAREEEVHKKKMFQPYFLNQNDKKPSVSELSSLFIQHENLTPDHIRFWRGEFFIYDGSKYQQIKMSDLRARVVSFLTTSVYSDKFRLPWVDEAVTGLTGLGHLSPNIEAGADILEPNKKKNLIFLKNCVLNLDESNAWKVEQLPHDPRYFSQVALPYCYEPNAECNSFLKTLSEILPDKDTRDFLQEWFGYNLIHDTSQGKFLVLLGEGANGKTVVLSVLTALIGKQNVSAIPLENFTATRTFPIAVTIGKLANVVDEMGQLKGVEATLKQFVSGSLMNVERKGKDGVEQKPTARLTFATNTLPTFYDRSDGLWRRMIVIPMQVQILDESKQNKNLSRVEYWERSEELAGILNWAIAGLQRLMGRGYFVEPKCASEFKAGFRQESDHVSSFIEEHLTENAKGEVGATTLYSNYTSYSKFNGHPVVTSAAFAAAIRKAFPKAIKSDQPKVMRDKRRERVWSGLSLESFGGTEGGAW
ncbi:DNA primase family protein [Bdellovibrio sp. BCCA]|uniref:DNA primase family protein n=1 Tax=Bdellovibrio sp. BCCA TaxID=3136281 RepID=UPI0030F1029C